MDFNPRLPKLNIDEVTNVPRGSAVVVTDMVDTGNDAVPKIMEQVNKAAFRTHFIREYAADMVKRANDGQPVNDGDWLSLWHSATSVIAKLDESLSDLVDDLRELDTWKEQQIKSGYARMLVEAEEAMWYHLEELTETEEDQAAFGDIDDHCETKESDHHGD